MDKLYDCVIIGGGPAGLGASVYAARAGLSTLVVEKTPMCGGQVLETTDVDNYLGLGGITGFELGEKFKTHSSNLGAEFAEDTVVDICEEGSNIRVVGKKDNYLAKTVILAMGAKHALLDIPGEKEHKGMGVSYCATCDGAFFRKRTVAVVGGGDVAVEDAIYLSGLCQKVFLIHRRDKLRANLALQDRLMKCDNVQILWNSTVEEIHGDDVVETISVKKADTNEVEEVSVDGIFVAIGMKPETAILEGKVNLDNGYVVAGEDCVTSMKGVFVAGDIRTKELRQIITAVADGANAVNSAERHIRGLKD